MSDLNLSESGARQSDPEHALAAIVHQARSLGQCAGCTTVAGRDAVGGLAPSPPRSNVCCQRLSSGDVRLP